MSRFAEEDPGWFAIAATGPYCAHTWFEGSDTCIGCGEALAFEEDAKPCPDCGLDPDDPTLHREGCRRVLPRTHPLERLQFGPPFEPWTRSHWIELERARVTPPAGGGVA